MYYITKKDSETGKKFTEVYKKINDANKEARKLAEKYGSKSFYQDRWSMAGGIESLIIEGEVNNPALRKEKGSNNTYVPALKTKEGKSLAKLFKDLPRVTKKEVNAIVNHKEVIFSNIGYNFNNPDYVGFILDEKWNVTPPDDCEEVTTTKYKEMFNITN